MWRRDLLGKNYSGAPDWRERWKEGIAFKRSCTFYLPAGRQALYVWAEKPMKGLGLTKKGIWGPSLHLPWRAIERGVLANVVKQSLKWSSEIASSCLLAKTPLTWRFLPCNYKKHLYALIRKLITYNSLLQRLENVQRITPACRQAGTTYNFPPPSQLQIIMKK